MDRETKHALRQAGNYLRYRTIRGWFSFWMRLGLWGFVVLSTLLAAILACPVHVRFHE
jgi:hypothetical protein